MSKKQPRKKEPRVLTRSEAETELRYARERIIHRRENGSIGGEERASRHDPVVLQDWSSRGGKQVLEKYGREYFVELRKKRKHYPSFWTSPSNKRKLRSLTNQRNGRKGGVACASRYGSEHLKELGWLGGIATRNRHGSNFFREIRKEREYYPPQGYKTRKTKARLRKEALEQANASPDSPIAALWRAVAKNCET
jgi:general stress protein YciG